MTIFDMTKWRAFADHKLNFDKMTIFLCDRVESTKGKEEKTGYQHFLLFLQCFPKPSSLGSLKVSRSEVVLLSNASRYITKKMENRIKNLLKMIVEDRSGLFFRQKQEHKM